MNQILTGWKTRIWAVIVAVLGAVVVLDPSMIVDIVGKQNQGYVLIGIAIVTAVLREFAATPAGEAEKFDA